MLGCRFFVFFQAEDGIRDGHVTGVQTCALPICPRGEDSLIAAQRELQEEVGLTAQRWEKLFDLQLSNSVTDEVGTIYLARELDSCKSKSFKTVQFRHR